MPHPAPLSAAERARRSRRRRREHGIVEVLFQLPDHAVGIVDEHKQRQGLRNRSQALLQLIERGRATAQQTP